METILRDLGRLAGIQHGCIYRHGRVLASTFPAAMNDGLAGMARLLEQMFRGARSIGKSHNEIYLQMGDNVLVGYFTEQEYVIAFLASQKVNFSLVHVSMLSAARELESAKSMEMSDPSVSQAAPAAATGDAEPLSEEPKVPEASEDPPEPAPPKPRTMYRGVPRW